MATFFERYSESELRTAKSRAIDEAVSLGRSGLRRKYGFGSAKKFVAVTAGHHFDSKALSAAVAAHLTPPLALTSDSSSGGVATTRILDGCDIPWIDTDRLKNGDRSGQDTPDAAGADSSAHVTRNYWWASQGENYSTVIQQGSLWAPHFRVDGRPGHDDWQALHRMMPGDVVFHYAAQQFKAISLVVAAGVESDRPPGYDGYPHGTLVLVQPCVVDMEVRLDVLKTVFPPGVGPMNRTGNPGRVYVAAIPPEVGEPLTNYLSAGSLGMQSLAQTRLMGESDTGQQLDIETTDIAGAMFRRAEQRYLREALLARYGNQCAICGRFLPKNLLIAAHIKLRSQSSHRDRLDFAAAAMLACSLGCDALFERGYLTVDDGGLVRTTPWDDPELLSVLDKLGGSRCLAFSEATKENFEFHRQSHNNGTRARR
ncbi:hypothetical protein [Pseudarthrobacter sp. IC2-21]|uniref:hypothetical protein n=1 Tax=Pseudarthrobacter sp. IC2-21 TaxID=3092262 RepID=UPI002A6B1246|nr:hypothetical protein [Pseudarthrobacter sp. IC2-21]